jgi:hypothetical protein
MKIVVIVKTSILLQTIILSSCNLEVNTSDPQASINIESSKRDSLYISKYVSSTIPNDLFQVQEAWIEYVWLNKIEWGNKIKVKSNSIQLNLKLSQFSNPDFHDDKYMIEWEMEDSTENVFGKGNGVYILILKRG